MALRTLVNQFAVLIVDNEVTLSHFVTSPPLAWTRLTERSGRYEFAEGYPCLLTIEQAHREMKNWDEVSLQGIKDTLKGLNDSVDYVLIGNNAGQGLPIAQSLPQNLIGRQAAIIYGDTLPEINDYQNMGYRSFFRRSEAVSHLLDLGKRAARPLALFFINTIQHNDLNYHRP
jgi:hypothetical protein